MVLERGYGNEKEFNFSLKFLDGFYFLKIFKVFAKRNSDKMVIQKNLFILCSLITMMSNRTVTTNPKTS